MIPVRLCASALLLSLTVPAVPAAPAAAQSDGCRGVRVPGAQHAVTSCLDDLTTAGTTRSGHTDPADWAGLVAPGAVTPSGVPGVQVDGYFPDRSTTNTNHGWRHDAQFVLRLPRDWNGGLVVAGPPGTREQYANDPIIADQVLSRGYAFAATDKGHTGAAPAAGGRRPGASIAEWHRRVTQLTRAARATLARHYGHAPRRTYAAGLSAGGYLVRWQLERHPELYTGGVDWNALIFTSDTNLLTTLAPAVRAYPAYARGDSAAHAELLAAGYPAGSEPAWAFSFPRLWTPLLHQVRTELDPAYAGEDAAYDLSARPRSVHRAIDRLSLTGRLTRPLISVQGSLDALTPPSRYAAAYRGLVAEAGRTRLHRPVPVPGGVHTDGMVALSPDFRPGLPAFTAAFEELEDWTGCRR
ncbi:tannase/feruloyl esterase family alpha/beta hydrolase [Streptomyces synnematoformans]|uniref:Tannase/feruloyl esterase family alpha/beta hydrolase n=1 Tax=Streptomyces synnematoformans TaxID=415721 RepID=A0ABN2YWS3_9ACTN